MHSCLATDYDFEDSRLFNFTPLKKKINVNNSLTAKELICSQTRLRMNFQYVIHETQGTWTAYSTCDQQFFLAKEKNAWSEKRTYCSISNCDKSTFNFLALLMALSGRRTRRTRKTLTVFLEPGSTVPSWFLCITKAVERCITRKIMSNQII